MVNNAGYGAFGAIEQMDDAAVEAQFDVNLFAALTVLRATLPALRASAGRVIQISSFFSRLAVPGSGFYSASKSPLQLISEALALELAPAGVHVTSIHPGYFATEFLESTQVVAPDDIYAGTVGTTLSEVTKKAWDDPNIVVEAVLNVVAHPAPPQHLAVGQDAVQAVRQALQHQLDELAEWEEYSWS